MSRYSALSEFLRHRDDEVVELSFEEIDELVGGLPPSARKHASWWANSTKPSGQSRFWMSVGRKAQPEMDQLLVRFRRAEVPTVPTAKAALQARSENYVVTRKPVALAPTGEFVRTTLAYEWQHAGSVGLVNGKLELPILPGRPGVYRFHIAHVQGVPSFYVGETDNLFRRMGNYRNPDPSQQTNIRIDQLLRDVIEKGGQVMVDVITAALLGGDVLDLVSKAARCLVENVALCELARSGASVDNL